MSFLTSSRSVRPLLRVGCGGMFVAVAVLTTDTAARGAVSTSPVSINDPNAFVTINSAGTQTVSGTAVTTNDINTYNIDAPISGLVGFEVRAHAGLTIGTGATIEQTLSSNQETGAVIELDGSSPTTIDGGTIQLNAAPGEVGAFGTVLVSNGEGSTTYFRSGAINVNYQSDSGAQIAVLLANPRTSFVMTGGSINDTSGANYLLELADHAMFTLSGGQLTEASPTPPVVVVYDFGTINLFGTGFNLNTDQQVANGTYTFSSEVDVIGTLLDGTATSFNAFPLDPNGAITVNINVGTPPAVPEPASLSLMAGVVGAVALRRHRRRK